MFSVNGHSMEPDFPDGSLVFVERAPEGSLRYGDLVAYVVASVPYVKV